MWKHPVVRKPRPAGGLCPSLAAQGCVFHVPLDEHRPWAASLIAPSGSSVNGPVVEVLRHSLTVKRPKGKLRSPRGFYQRQGFRQNTKWKYSCNVKHAANEGKLDSSRLFGSATDFASGIMGRGNERCGSQYRENEWKETKATF